MNNLDRLIISLFIAIIGWAIGFIALLIYVNNIPDPKWVFIPIIFSAICGLIGFIKSKQIMKWLNKKC